MSKTSKTKKKVSKPKTKVIKKTKIITKTAKYSIPFYKSDPPIQMTTLGEDASILGASIIASS